MAFPVSEAVIEAAESHLGTRLLASHRARLARDNGGEIVCGGEVWQLHAVWDDTDRRRAARTANNIVHETQEARNWSEFPPDAISIASNGTGDQLLFRPASGSIEYWEHETGTCAPVEIDWGKQ